MLVFLWARGVIFGVFSMTPVSTESFVKPVWFWAFRRLKLSEGDGLVDVFFWLESGLSLPLF